MKCLARQHSDQMICHQCGLVWDVNDPEPPVCKREAVARNYASHTLYETGDKDCPQAILDRNGEVVLGLCRVCGCVEVELGENYCTRSAPSDQKPVENQ